MIVPATVSAGVGLYVAFRSVEEGENDPVPLVDHIPPVATEEMVPLRLTTALFEHTLMSAPAVTTGASVIVITNWSVTARHPPLLVEVNVSVTVPAAVSAALGT